MDEKMEEIMMARLNSNQPLSPPKVNRPLPEDDVKVSLVSPPKGKNIDQNGEARNVRKEQQELEEQFA
jgi:hypothetical protein